MNARYTFHFNFRFFENFKRNQDNSASLISVRQIMTERKFFQQEKLKSVDPTTDSKYNPIMNPASQIVITDNDDNKPEGKKNNLDDPKNDSKTDNKDDESQEEIGNLMNLTYDSENNSIVSLSSNKAKNHDSDGQPSDGKLNLENPTTDSKNNLVSNLSSQTAINDDENDKIQEENVAEYLSINFAQKHLTKHE